MINNSMDYKKHYNLLIEKSRNRQVEGYTEKHHIVPKCLGGTDDAENIAVLTAEEHFLAHQLLVKMYPNSPPLVNAVLIMTTHHTTNRINNKLYGWLRKRASLARKEWLAVNGHPRGFLGKHHKDEDIDRITIGLKQAAKEKRVKIFAYNLDGTFYKEYNSIIGCAEDLGTNPSNVKYTAEGKFGYCKGKQLRYDYTNSIAPYTKPIHPLKGRTRTTEHQEKLNEAIRNNKATCIYCGHNSSKSAITRFHDENCKEKKINEPSTV